jgi:hypothetical protein
MSRPWSVAVPLLLLALAPPARGQDEGGGLFGPSPLGARQTARAKFEATQATTKDLGRARLEEAREEFLARMERYLAGKDTLDITLGAAKRLLEAELAVAQTRSDRIAAHDRYRRHALELEKLTEEKQWVGRESLADVLDARRVRRSAEMALASANANQEKRGVAQAAAPLLPKTDVLNARREAQAAFEAAQSSVKELAAARVETARAACREHYKRFREGKFTLDFTLESVRQVCEAELALRERPAARAALAEVWWSCTREGEKLSRLKLEIGRESVADVAQWVSLRLTAEIELVQALAAAGKLPREDVSGPLELANEPGEEVRELAHARFEASRATLPELARTGREVALIEFAWRYERYRAGKDWLDIVLDATKRLLEAELAVAATKADRVAAHERHWLRVREFEVLSMLKQTVGRESIADVAQARSVRLTAEMALAEAKAAKDGK